MKRRFSQLDVFGARPYRGNPLAVVVDADGLSTDAMQAIARWTNLSETTFLLPPSDPAADYRVRIFTPGGELPFAGHPTLGSCHAWLEAGGEPNASDEIVQECGVGLVRLRRVDGQLAFAAPALLRSGPVEGEPLERALSVTGLRPEDVVAAEWVDNGPGWLALLLPDAQAVLAVEPGAAAAGETLDIGLVGLYPPGSECAIEVRALFSAGPGQLREDPVTGSLNASVAQWLLGSARLSAPYVASQGGRLDVEGRVHISRDDAGQVWVGGSTVTLIEGAIEA